MLRSFWKEIHFTKSPTTKRLNEMVDPSGENKVYFSFDKKRVFSLKLNSKRFWTMDDWNSTFLEQFFRVFFSSSFHPQGGDVAWSMIPKMPEPSSVASQLGMLGTGFSTWEDAKVWWETVGGSAVAAQVVGKIGGPMTFNDTVVQTLDQTCDTWHLAAQIFTAENSWTHDDSIFSSNFFHFFPSFSLKTFGRWSPCLDSFCSFLLRGLFKRIDGWNDDEKKWRSRLVGNIESLGPCMNGSWGRKQNSNNTWSFSLQVRNDFSSKFYRESFYVGKFPWEVSTVDGQMDG